jgi:hypothetical protein
MPLTDNRCYPLLIAFIIATIVLAGLLQWLGPGNILQLELSRSAAEATRVIADDSKATDRNLKKGIFGGLLVLISVLFAVQVLRAAAKPYQGGAVSDRK